MLISLRLTIAITTIICLPFSVVIYIIHTHSNGGVPRRYKTVLIDCLQK